MKKILKYNQFNEGLKEWISTAMLLVNLGFLNGNILANNDTKEEAKKIVNELDNKDIDTLKIFNDIKEKYNKNIFYKYAKSFSEINKDDYISYKELLSMYDTSKKDTMFNNTELLDFLKYIETSNNIPVSVNCILIDLPINDRILRNVPLYNFRIDGGKIKLNVSSMMTKDISVNVDLGNNVKFIFMHNIMFTSFGINYNLK
jgi:hypothetical protein